MVTIYVPWAKRALEDARQGLDGADLIAMLTPKEKAKVEEVRKILAECAAVLGTTDEDFMTFTEENEEA